MLEDEFGYETPLYTRPMKYRMNVQPVNSSADIQEFGERTKEMQKTVIEYKKYFNKFKEFDVAYLDGKSPLDEGGEYIVNVSELHEANINVVNELEVVNLATGEVKAYACPHANYKLYPPRNQNKCIVIYFEKISSK